MAQLPYRLSLGTFRKLLRIWTSLRLYCTVLGTWKPRYHDVLSYPFERHPRCSWLGADCCLLGALRILSVPLCLLLLGFFGLATFMLVGKFVTRKSTWIGISCWGDGPPQPSAFVPCGTRLQTSQLSTHHRLVKLWRCSHFPSTHDHWYYQRILRDSEDEVLGTHINHGPCTIEEFHTHDKIIIIEGNYINRELAFHLPTWSSTSWATLMAGTSSELTALCWWPVGSTWSLKLWAALLDRNKFESPVSTKNLIT